MSFILWITLCRPSPVLQLSRTRPARVATVVRIPPVRISLVLHIVPCLRQALRLTLLSVHRLQSRCPSLRTERSPLLRLVRRTARKLSPLPSSLTFNVGFTRVWAALKIIRLNLDTPIPMLQ